MKWLSLVYFQYYMLCAPNQVSQTFQTAQPAFWRCGDLTQATTEAVGSMRGQGINMNS